MPIVETQRLVPGAALPASDNLQIYCGLDSCVTLEVFEELQRTFGEPPEIYQFELALQAPYLEMMQRGFAVDLLEREKECEGLRRRIAALQATLDEFAGAIWPRLDAKGLGLNPASPKQLQEFFYGELGLPEVWISQKGQRKLSTNREALEKLDQYLYARPFVSCILAIRDLAKQLDTLSDEVDGDGRFRTSYNIAGTETGRPSSSTNAFGTGGNAQNIAPGLRHVFLADSGWKLAVVDLEQVEARDVGFICGCLFDDWSYLDACELGDLHTNNAKRIWPELAWTGSPARDRLLANNIFYRDFSYRDMSKRGSHLSNYMGTAWTAARTLKVPQQIMEDFQSRYIKGASAAFPVIPRWWQWAAQELQTTHQLVTPFGRRRHFFGRPGDDTTLREAIAFLPQSTTADRTNLGLWRLWKKLPEVEVLAQTYDSVTFQVHEGPAFDRTVAEALELMKVELVSPNGRKYVVPGEAKIGWNWGNASEKNPEGLLKWDAGKPDGRSRRSRLERVMAR